MTKKNINKQECFIIAPIGESDSDVRKRSDQVLEYVISPALGDFNYEAVRADKISEPGMITSQVIQKVVNSALVIADLTGQNPNVFYELAIRHAIKKPLIQIIKKSEQMPFDVAGTRTIQVDLQDLDSVANAKKEIIAQITSLEKNPNDQETPISVSLDLQTLKQSDSPEQRSLGDVLSTITEIKTSIRGIEKGIHLTKDMMMDRNPRRHFLRMEGEMGIRDEVWPRLSHLSRRFMTFLPHISKKEEKEYKECVTMLGELVDRRRDY